MKLAWAARSAKRRDSKPAVMSHGPVSSRPRKAKPVTEQELGEAVAGAHEITAQVLAAAQQVTEALLGGPRKAKAGRPCLIDRDQLLADSPEVGKHRLRWALDPPANGLAGGEVEREQMGLLGMDVETHARHSVGHGRHLPKLGCRPEARPPAQSPHFFALGAGLSTQPRDGAGGRAALHRGLVQPLDPESVRIGAYAHAGSLRDRVHHLTC